MAKVILICGKICSGKSFYARQLQRQHQAVILSTDETTFDLIHNEQGESYVAFARRVNAYLQKKAAEIVHAGANVILDWGFWTRAERRAITDYFLQRSVPCEWHYLDVTDDLWQRRIAERNRRVQSGCGGSDFYVDEGLLNKLLCTFEPPAADEIDVWIDAHG